MEESKGLNRKQQKKITLLEAQQMTETKTNEFKN